jgi:hypothetical protein
MILGIFIVAASAFAAGAVSCTVNVTGAPCVTDQNCPKGQYCGTDGLCKGGTRPGQDGGIPDGSDPGKDGGKTDAGDAGTQDGGWKCTGSGQCDQDAGQHVCVGGACVPGNCVDRIECQDPGKPTCGTDHYCSDACDTDAGTVCGKNYRCCTGHCLEGDCCGDPDCPAGKCLGNVCVTHCEKPDQCQSNLCCDGTCAVPLKGCCSKEDCKNSDFGLRCDYNVCKCTEDSECKEGMICDKTTLQCKAGCSDVHPCKNTGDVCCGSACHAGDCCGNADCKDVGKPTCESFTCSGKCDPGDDKCGLGWKCCSSGDAGYSCTTAYCCSSADCKDADKPYCDLGNKTPQCINKCGPTVGDTKCGEGYVCCGGTCHSGNCCETKDCAVGKCINYNCAKDCTEADGGSYCDISEKCCFTGANKGRCYNGACCDSIQCTASPNGKACLADFSCGCTVKGDCAGGQVCYKSKCINGDCVSSADCTDGAKPICGPDHYCKACSGDSSCVDSGKGEICCSGYCLKGSCCTSSSPTEDDCEEFVEKPVCDDATLECRGCINNLDCTEHGLDPKCCTTDSSMLKGDCYAGECCSSFNCTSVSELTKTPICDINNRTCTACQSDYQCRTDFNNPVLKCCKADGLAMRGACYSGTCCDNSQCSSPTKYCNPKFLKCTECVENADCNTGGNYAKVCCNGTCMTGGCCADADCIKSSGLPNAVCYENRCRIHCGDSGNKCPTTTPAQTCCGNLMPPLPTPFPLCSTSGHCCYKNSDCDFFLEKCCHGICIGTLMLCE